MRARWEVSITETGRAPADRVWELLSTPACWPAWSPQIRHVTTEDGVRAPGRVQAGQALRIHLLVPGLTVPVRITDVRDPVSWEMLARLPLGRIRSSHRIVRGPTDCAVTVTLRWSGPARLGSSVLGSYRPLAAVAVRRLLRLAAAEAQGAEVARRRRCEA